MSVGRNSLLGSYRLGSLNTLLVVELFIIWSLIVFPMFAKNVLKPLAMSFLLLVSIFPI